MNARDVVEMLRQGAEIALEIERADAPGAGWRLHILCGARLPFAVEGREEWGSVDELLAALDREGIWCGRLEAHLRIAAPTVRPFLARLKAE